MQVRRFHGAVILATVLAAPTTYAQQNNWPMWRGPAGTGVATGTPPSKWNDTTNVAFKVAIPGRGYSTPVTWGDRIYLTTAIPTGKGTPPAQRGGRGAGGGTSSNARH